jgi:beta-phosphoglucomutase-like phosphatase (HAD superfamily)
MILGEDTELHKPHPEPYLMALTRLGTKAPETIVIEDSPNGVKSAKAAGCCVLGIATGFATSELLAAGADHAAENFEALTLLIHQLYPAGRR